MSDETTSERIKKLDKGLKQLEEANELLKSVKELKELGNQVEDWKLAKAEKKLRELQDAQWKHRDACGRKIKRKLYDSRGCEI